MVYTLRKPRGEGETAARHGGLYSFKMLGRVEVELVEPNASDEFLLPFVPRSGFASLAEWKGAAASGATHLYVVRLKHVGW